MVQRVRAAIRQAGFPAPALPGMHRVSPTTSQTRRALATGSAWWGDRIGWTGFGWSLGSHRYDAAGVILICDALRSISPPRRTARTPRGVGCALSGCSDCRRRRRPAGPGYHLTRQNEQPGERQLEQHACAPPRGSRLYCTFLKKQSGDSRVRSRWHSEQSLARIQVRLALVRRSGLGRNSP
jgi:hypothetical protein